MYAFLGAMRNETLLVRTNWIVYCSIKSNKETCMHFQVQWESIIIDSYILHNCIRGNKEQIGMIGCNGKCNITYRLHWSY